MINPLQRRISVEILREQHRVFVDEYLTHFNASKSAIKAGYSPDYANRIGYELLQRDDIKQAVEQGMQARSDANKLERMRIIDGLERIAYADMRDFINWSEDGIEFIDPSMVDGTVIAEVSINPNGKKTIKLADRMKAIELLAKYHGMLTDKVSISGTPVIQIIDDIAEPMALPQVESNYIELN
jgi:phage terminase small subunit